MNDTRLQEGAANSASFLGLFYTSYHLNTLACLTIRTGAVHTALSRGRLELIGNEKGLLPMIVIDCITIDTCNKFQLVVLILPSKSMLPNCNSDVDIILKKE